MPHNEMDNIYRNLPPDKIPWNMETPPKELINLVRSGIISPCKTIDLGCGTGNQAIYLAQHGFEVTGIDISPVAIQMAKEKAIEKRVICNFLVQDILREIKLPQETYDFAYDWAMLHHIFPKKRQKYVQNLTSILKEDGYYLLVCFSEKDPQFGGSGKYRKTPLGTTLYFSSEEEIITLFQPKFEILEIKTIEIKGKFAPHQAIYALMKKK